MSDLDSLHSDLSYYRRRKSQYQSEQSAVKQKIRRLKNTKNSVAGIKSSVSDARSYIGNKMETHQDTWAGENQRTVNEIHINEINAGYDRYYNDVDAVLDAICDEITRLENENRHLGFLLNSVVNSINSICNEIEKLTN